MSPNTNEDPLLNQRLLSVNDVLSIFKERVAYSEIKEKLLELIASRTKGQIFKKD